ncbi:MAG: hypothetical protein JO053_11385 [Acidobacteria bacterium]|nr:hypothetical protein [Acidobacteriota bacterium]
MKEAFRIFLVFSFAFLLCALGACSIPNLESQNCSEARDAVKQLYSFHFANDMSASLESLKAREKFLSPEFYQRLVASNPSVDPFTFSADPPKTFKIAKCTEKAPADVDMQVQIYWRDEQKTTQKEVHVDTVRSGDKWLVNDVK